MLRIVQDNPSVTQKEIAARMGKSERTVKTITVHLQKEGVLRRANAKRNGYREIVKDNLNWKSYEIENTPIPPLSDAVIEQLNQLYEEYLADIEANANKRQTTGKSSYTVDSFKEYKIGKSKAIIDKIDDLICPLYGLSSEETEFVKGYELEFRMSGESE